MDDTKILEKIEQAKELYEDGAILEMQELLLEIIDDIDEFSYDAESRGGLNGKVYY